MIEFTPFAKFENSGELKYRTETYLILTKEKEEFKNKEFLKILKDKKCIGVVIMLNPGSSYPNGGGYGEIVEAEPDDTMEQIEKCIFKSCEGSLPNEGYIEIFNLFNLCCTSSKEVIEKYKKKDHYLINSQINIEEINIKRETPWIWIAWGCDKEIDSIKKEVSDKITHLFPKNIMINFPCKNNEYGFWHPLQIRRGITKQNELIDYISNEIKRLSQHA